MFRITEVPVTQDELSKDEDENKGENPLKVLPESPKQDSKINKFRYLDLNLSSNSVTNDENLERINPEVSECMGDLMKTLCITCSALGKLFSYQLS